MNQERNNEAAGEELFMEELGQVHGGTRPIGPIPVTLARYEVETGLKEPLFPRPPQPVTTQALREVGPTLPPPLR